MTAHVGSLTAIKVRSILGLVASGLWKAAWTFCALCWPLLKWVVALEVLWRLLSAIYHWNDPASHAGWIFILHFLVFSALTYFVACYKPKGI